jgi:hypothetical protein
MREGTAVASLGTRSCSREAARSEVLGVTEEQEGRGRGWPVKVLVHACDKEQA